MLRDNSGNRLFRTVEVKVVYPKGFSKPSRFVQHAGPRKGFGPKALEDILNQAADQIDKLYPWWDFSLVPLKPSGRIAKYIFSFSGYRPVEGTQPIPESKTAMEIAAQLGETDPIEAAIARSAAAAATEE